MMNERKEKKSFFNLLQAAKTILYYVLDNLVESVYQFSTYNTIISFVIFVNKMIKRILKS